LARWGQIFAPQNFFPLEIFFDFSNFSGNRKEILGGNHDERTIRCSGPAFHFVRARGALAKRQ
jgi:hypothetical protein